MKFLLSILLVIIAAYTGSAQTLKAQYRTVDSIALSIPAAAAKTTDGIANHISTHFTKQEDKVRAAFIWVASTFAYDVPNMYAMNYYATEQEKITKPLATHKGICENYAAVFNDICKKLGIRSYMLVGYTRKYGQPSFLPHAWCGVNVDSTWYLYDPTWAAGYVQNNKFVARIDEAYYKVSPAVFIKSHIPFDPMWEMLNYPVTNTEFGEGHTEEDKQKPFFSYADSINAWEQLGEEQKLLDAQRRIEANGVTSDLVFSKLRHVKEELEYINTNKYNASVSDYNKAVRFLNVFIDYRNHEFMPTKPDAEIKTMLDSADNRLAAAHSKLATVKVAGTVNEELVTGYKKSLDDFARDLNIHRTFLTRYIGKNKLTRKLMFTRLEG